MKASQYALIVAGGSGLRMGSKIPKQFLEMRGMPILMRTITAFHNYSAKVEIVVVLPKSHLKLWGSLCKHHNFHVSHLVVPGGENRFQSVKAGLEKIPDGGLVAIHDGVRPVINSALIKTSFTIASNTGSAVPVIPLNESLRKLDNDNSNQQCDRDLYRLVQTPQTFEVKAIKEAYLQAEHQEFTDDAGVWEASGRKVTLFDGYQGNIKITTIQDLVLAEVLLKFI